MTEQRATDWKGPVAIVLAGLALLVALSGRGFPFGGPPNMALRVERMPVPTAVPGNPMPPGLYGMTEPVPMVPGGPELRQEIRDKWAQVWGQIEGVPFGMAVPDKPVPPMAPMPAQGGYYFDGGRNVLDDAWNYMRDAYSYFQPLLQLALVVLLGVVLFTWLGRRRARPPYPAGYYPSYPGYPPQPPPPAPAGQVGQDETPPSGYPGPGVLD